MSADRLSIRDAFNCVTPGCPEALSGYSFVLNYNGADLAFTIEGANGGEHMEEYVLVDGNDDRIFVPRAVRIFSKVLVAEGAAKQIHSYKMGSDNLYLQPC